MERNNKLDEIDALFLGFLFPIAAITKNEVEFYERGSSPFKDPILKNSLNKVSLISLAIIDLATIGLAIYSFLDGKVNLLDLLPYAKTIVSVFGSSSNYFRYNY